MLVVAAAVLSLNAGSVVQQKPLNRKPVRVSQWTESWTNPKLAGSSWRITLNVGREPGMHQMPEDWAKSGARLSLPLEISFTDDLVSGSDPGGDWLWTIEELACCPSRRLLATAGSFVGAQGEVNVPVHHGGWLAEPPDRCGMSVLRFYLDFPDGAQRNDAVLPAGRVFFQAACWDESDLNAFEAEAEVVQAELDELQGGGDRTVAEQVEYQREGGGSQRAEVLGFQLEILQRSLPTCGVLSGSGGVQLAAEGTLSVKRNWLWNLWGALNNRFCTIGRFSFAPLTRNSEST